MQADTEAAWACTQAARYQMIIMFIISSTTSVSAVACLVSTRCVPSN